MLDSCLEWQLHHLGTAPAIQRATGSYFEAQDSFGRWLDERCILDATLSTRPGQLQADFATWARENGEQSTLSAADFREAIERTKGLKYTVYAGTRLVRGIGFKTDHSPMGR